MSNRIFWYPSTDANIASYTLDRAPDLVSSWTTLTTITHNLGNPAVFDAVAGYFFYEDATGTTTDWYRLTATDSFAQSATGAPFLVGDVRDGTTPYTSTALVATIKRRAMLPVSQVTLSAGDLMSMADEEVLTNLVPLIMSANEDFFLTSVDLPYVGDTYRIPRRAIGAKLHSVVLVDSNGTELPVTRTQASAPEHVRLGFYIRSGYVVLVNRDNRSFPTLRLRFYLRPSKLVGESEVAYVTAINPTTGVLSLNGLPPSLLATTKLDVLKGAPPFDALLADTTGTFVGPELTLAQEPVGIEVGDIVAPAGQANVVQLPVEWFPVLAQAVAVKAMEALGDSEGMAAAAAVLSSMRRDALSLVSNRVDNNVELVQAQELSPWRRW